MEARLADLSSLRDRVADAVQRGTLALEEVKVRDAHLLIVTAQKANQEFVASRSASSSVTDREKVCVSRAARLRWQVVNELIAAFEDFNVLQTNLVEGAKASH